MASDYKQSSSIPHALVTWMELFVGTSGRPYKHGRINIPGPPMPKSFTTVELQRLFRTMQYSVSEKSDGEGRAMIVSKDRIWMINRALQQWHPAHEQLVKTLCPHSDKGLTIFVGEYVDLYHYVGGGENDEKDSSSSFSSSSVSLVSSISTTTTMKPVPKGKCFIVYDCLGLNGHNVSQLPSYEMRIQHVRRWLHEAVRFSDYAHLRVKEPIFSYKESLEAWMEKCMDRRTTAAWWYISHEHKDQYKVDGLLFTPAQDNFMCSLHRLPLLKLKQHHSIDVMISVENLLIPTPAIHSTAITLTTRTIRLYIKTSSTKHSLFTTGQFTEADYNRVQTEITTSAAAVAPAITTSMIIEVYIDPHAYQRLGSETERREVEWWQTQMFPVRYLCRRTDKMDANFVTTIMSTLSDACHQPSLSELNSIWGR